MTRSAPDCENLQSSDGESSRDVNAGGVRHADMVRAGASMERMPSSLALSALGVGSSVLFQLIALYRIGYGPRSDLYYASIVIPSVVYSLAFGSFNNILVPMFVEAQSGGESGMITLYFNCLQVVIVGGCALLLVLYLPMILTFAFLFRRLGWIDMREVGLILIAFSVYQILYSAMLAKNCLLYSRGKSVAAQVNTICAWTVSLVIVSILSSLARIAYVPMCLAAGCVVALLIPNPSIHLRFYRGGLLREHITSVFRRGAPVTAGTVVGWVEPALDSVIASYFHSGSLTIYYLFSKCMFYLITTIFAGFVQPTVRALASLAAVSEWAIFRSRMRNALLASEAIAISALIAIVAGLLTWRHIPFLPFQKYVAAIIGQITLLLLLSGYLLGSVGYALYSSALYVLRREHLFLWLSFSVFGGGIMFKLIGAWRLGLHGLALGTSLYWLLYSIVLAAGYSAVTRRKLSRVPVSLQAIAYDAKP
jgi:hypothetical protein